MPYTPPATDWTTAANAQIARHNSQGQANYLYGSSTPSRIAPIQAPSDMAEFRKSFGNGYASEQDYKNWQAQKQRVGGLTDFVNNMSVPDAAAQGNTARIQADNTARIQADATKYGQGVDQFLGQAVPTMDTGNRFENGLGTYEQQLQQLLTNPDSINQSAAYKFRVGQGQEALNRSLGARGLLNSGNRLMELTKYGQDMASQEYGNQADRLGSLVNTYTQGYNADKSANTAAFSAKSGAWNNRGNLLSNLYSGATTAANQDISSRESNRVGFANAWTNQAPKPYTQFPTQYVGNGSMVGG